MRHFSAKSTAATNDAATNAQQQRNGEVLIYVVDAHQQAMVIAQQVIAVQVEAHRQPDKDERAHHSQKGGVERCV